MADTDRTLIELPLAAPIEAAWAALREPAHLQNWFGWDHPGLADEIDYIFRDHSTADAATRTINFGGYEGASDSFSLAPSGAGSTLRIYRRGEVLPADGSVPYDEMTEGWITFAQQLRLYLDRHPGATRRTIYLSGPIPAGQPGPIEALGLIGTATSPPGHEYEATGPGGETLTGEVWFRSPHQFGLTVAGYGDGIVVLMVKPASGSNPGTASVVVSTFDLDAARFAEIERHWTGWWQSRYPKVE